MNRNHYLEKDATEWDRNMSWEQDTKKLSVYID